LIQTFILITFLKRIPRTRDKCGHGPSAFHCCNSSFVHFWPILNKIGCFYLIAKFWVQKGKNMSASYMPASGSLLDGLEGPDVAGLQEVEAFIIDEGFRPGGSDQPDSTDVTADPIQKYLNEISAIPLLSPGDEKALAEQVRKGVEARSKLEKNDLQGKEAEQLRQLDARGKLAGRLLFQANLRFVVHLAKRYRCSGMSALDLIQEGNIGLLYAVEKFDHRKKTRFTTYAAWWIKQAICRAVAQQARPVRLPENQLQSINDINSIRRWLESEEDRETDPSEIALETGLLSAEDVAGIRASLAADKPLDPSLEKRWREAAGKVSGLMGLGREVVSLEKPADGEDGRTLEEQLKDGSDTDPLLVIQRKQINRKICEILNCLGEVERQVMMMRFGLLDGSEMTVEEVAEELNITPLRVKQLETKALRSLRHPDISDQLKALLK
jgi:RNA polymerase primary sigma factor